jgi:hypothetical protein
MLRTKDKATVVISYLRSCSFREKNLRLVLSLLNQTNIPVVVVEQINENNSKKIKVISGEKLTHISYFCKSVFHKSKLYNISVDYVKTEYVWFLDADVILPFEDIISRISSQELIRPVGGVYLLNKEDSLKVISNKSIDISEKQACKYFGKHSFIIKKSSLISCGMFDDKFLGWGWEDLDFVQTKASHIDPFVFEDLKGFHLFHPPAGRENERANYNVYIENKKSRKQLSYCFVINSCYSINSNDLKSILDTNRINERAINFNFVFFGDDIDISWIDFSLSEDIRSSYVSIFRYKNVKDKIRMINSCIYSSQGKIFSYFDDFNKVSSSNIIRPKITNEIILTMQGGSVDFYSNKNNTLFAYNRSDFNSFGGFSENIKINDSSFSGSYSKVKGRYNNKEDLMYFDVEKNCFLSV